MRIAGESLTNHLDGGSNGRRDEIVKRRVSEKLKGIKRSPETVERMRQAKLGARNPMFNKPVSDATRAKRSNSMLGSKNHRYGMTPPNGEATRFKPGSNNNPGSQKKTSP